MTVTINRKLILQLAAVIVAVAIPTFLWLDARASLAEANEELSALRDELYMQQYARERDRRSAECRRGCTLTCILELQGYETCSCYRTCMEADY